MNLFLTNAQNTESLILVESINNSGIKTESHGKCFSLSFVKTKNTYAFILIDKRFVINSKEIKFYFNNEKKAEAFIVSLPIEDENIIICDKIVAVPFYIFRKKLEENNIKNPIFTMEEFIPEMMNGITEKDIDEVKLKIEKSFTE
jgi:hypothetical protein